MSDASPQGTRINKYLSEVGHCSRRAADALLEQGRITINGVVPEMGTRVQPGDRVAVDGVEVATSDQERIVIAYHKPVGIVCTTDTRREKDNIIDAINFPTRVYPIGRLDKMSEGLIFLTNDGDIVNDILRARYGHEKEYHVTVNGPITPKFVQKMSSGVAILDTVTMPCEVEATAAVVQNHFEAGAQSPDSSHVRGVGLPSSTPEARAHHERRTRRFARGHLPSLGRFGDAQAA